LLKNILFKSRALRVEVAAHTHTHIHTQLHTQGNGGDDGSPDSLSSDEDGDNKGGMSREKDRLLQPPHHDHSNRPQTHHDHSNRPQKGGHAANGGGRSTRVGMDQNTHTQSDKAPSFTEKLRWMFGSIHVVLFLMQAILFGYGFGEWDRQVLLVSYEL